MPWFSILKSQCNHSLDSVLYERAYNHIVTDSLFVGKLINVSNKLTGTIYLFFSYETKGNRNFESWYMELLELDEKHALKDSVHIQFDTQFVKHKNPEFIMCFSPIVNNELFAEVHMSKFMNDPMGEVVYYYFKFDSKGNIKIVHKKRMYGL